MSLNNGPIVHTPVDIWVWRATAEWYWQGRTEGLGEKPVPVTLQIPYALAWVLTRASAMRGRRITACTSNFPHVCTFCILVSKSEYLMGDACCEWLLFLRRLKQLVYFNGELIRAKILLQDCDWTCQYFKYLRYNTCRWANHLHRILKRFIETKVPPGTPDAVMAQTGTGKKKRYNIKVTILIVLIWN
jgi:hypothetical protein